MKQINTILLFDVGAMSVENHLIINTFHLPGIN